MSRNFPRRPAVAILAVIVLASLSPALAEDGGESSQSAQEALDRTLAENPPASPSAPPGADLWSRPVGSGAQARLIDLSMQVMAAVGGSTLPDDEIAVLQGGAHDPNKRGFTFRQLEFSSFGAVDPYFNGEVHIVWSEEGVELEEAFATTTALPGCLQIEAGHFFTEFGRINPAHPHAWYLIDQPIVVSRLFGGDGTRQTGVRVGWLTPLPWFSEIHLGVQNASGETMPSFLGESEEEEGEDAEEPATPEEYLESLPTGLAGRPLVGREIDSMDDFVYLARWMNSWSLGSITTVLGASGLLGPNPTGPAGRTLIGGADLLVKWKPAVNFRGFPFVRWDTEVIARDWYADELRDPDGVKLLDAESVRDWGLFSSLLCGLTPRWSLGARGEMVTGADTAFAPAAARDGDGARDDRLRASSLIAFSPSEFAKLRLQYNYDVAEHLKEENGDPNGDGIENTDGIAHSVWLGLDIMFGAHPAHNF